MNWSEFFHMDGYAFYVWGSYGLTAIVLLANLILPLSGSKQQRRRLLGKIQRSQKG